MNSSSVVSWCPPIFGAGYASLAVLTHMGCSFNRPPTGSEIRVQHDAVTGLAGFKPAESLVDLAHREVFVLRRDLVPGSKVEHRLDRHRRANRRTRDAPLLHDEREGRDRDRFQHGTDDVQPAVRRQRPDQRVPIELGVDGADQEVEAAGELADRRRVFARDDVIRAEALRFIELALARRERRYVAAECGGELYRHVPQPADADDAY